MKINSLQETNPPCECGGKKEKSFVVKNKVYETRSGLQRKQEVNFSECSPKFSLKRLNLRSKVYLNEMEAPIKNLPLNVSNHKKSGRKCDLSKHVKVVTNGTFNGKDQQSLERTIQKHNTLDEKEQVTLSKSIEEDNVVVKSSVSVENIINENQNGEQCYGFLNVPIKQEFDGNENVSVYEKEKSLTDDKCYKSVNFGNLHKNCNDDPSSSNDTQKQKRNRKTNFELFLRETCESLKIGPVTCKRKRKTPTSYTSVLSPSKEYSTELKSNLTLAGVPKKKTRRKPKIKGPVHHYLDLYIKDKKMMTTSPFMNDSDCLKISNLQHDDVQNNDKKFRIPSGDNKQTSHNSVNNLSHQSKEINVDSIKVEIKNSPSPISTNLRFRYKTFSMNNGVDTIYPHNNTPIISKRKIQEQKLSKQKQKKQKVEKIEACDYASSVTHVLGYRTNKATREVLVHFEDGTSNWIPYIERETDKCSLQTFFEHEDQDISVINRLGYQAVCGSVDITTDDDNDSSTLTAFSDSSYFEDELESDSDEVFFTTFPSRHTDQLSKGSKNVLSDKDLNYVLEYVMSSHYVKLYPYECLQEVTSKSEEGFVHIYLRRINSNCQQKNIETLNLNTCEKLITELEECAFNDQCKVVVISGIEEYFAINNIFDKLLRKSAALERAKYEQDVSIIRYLIQTICNFNKPIVGVIKKTANGLSASLLSLFDMVYHERSFEVSKAKHGSDHTLSCTKRACGQRGMTMKKSEISNCENETCQAFMFPRLLGLSQSNEAKIMGEHHSAHAETCSFTHYTNPLSQQLKGSLKHMKNNCKIQLKSRGSRVQSIKTRQSLECEHAVTMEPAMSNFNEDHEKLICLQRQIQREKNLVENYMTELRATLDSLIS